ncbi:MAG: MBL fold metallo-hydrolase [Clostridia bacterium]|nr:MBL fold metallo-hydrolase [Clostridia bacterium]
MKVEFLLIGHLATYANCYGILTDKAAIVIDPGKYTLEVAQFLKDNADKTRLILITHAHYDHIGGALQLRNETGVKIAIGKNEEFALSDRAFNLSGRFTPAIPAFNADYTIEDEEELTVGDITVKAFETPGHTVGGMCYLINDCLFSGDMLFYETVGRVDLPGGNMGDMKESLDRMMWLFDDDVKVYSGHGEMTTIGHEREYNPYLR